jgi:hypothetical protein
MSDSQAFVSLIARLESNKEEEKSHSGNHRPLFDLLIFRSADLMRPAILRTVRFERTQNLFW